MGNIYPFIYIHIRSNFRFMIAIIFFTILFSANSTDLLLDMYSIKNWNFLEEIDNKKIYQADCVLNNDQYIMIEQEINKEHNNIISIIQAVSNYDNILSNKNIKTKLLLSNGDTSIAKQTITNAIPFTRDRMYIYKLYTLNKNRVDWFLIDDFNYQIDDFQNKNIHKLSFGAGSWEIKENDNKKLLIYRMYLDDEVNLPIMFMQKMRINYAVDIFNDVLTFSKGE